MMGIFSFFLSLIAILLVIILINDKSIHSKQRKKLKSEIKQMRLELFEIESRASNASNQLQKEKEKVYELMLKIELLQSKKENKKSVSNEIPSPKAKVALKPRSFIAGTPSSNVKKPSNQSIKAVKPKNNYNKPSYNYNSEVVESGYTDDNGSFD